MLSVRRKILYGSENELWDLVAKKMGGEYADLQETALGVTGASLEASSSATFRLFELTAQETWSLLDARQRAVVGHAKELSSRRS